VVDFTATTERMQSEELTALLNEYLTEMSQVAIEHGGSVNKFIGDAMLVFFGDYDSPGVKEDPGLLAQGLRHAAPAGRAECEMAEPGNRKAVPLLDGDKHRHCNVGNFGSDQRMDYTIIGAEANLAARLQSIAQPNGIVISYETFALVTDMVRAHTLEPITLKGVGRAIILIPSSAPRQKEMRSISPSSPSTRRAWICFLTCGR